MKGLFLGIALIILVGVGGLIYRNAVSRPVTTAGACTLDAKVCPDGSAVGRVAPDCNFAVCPPPNITLDAAGITFALPAGFSSIAEANGETLGVYGLQDPTVSTTASTTAPDELVIKQYAIPSGEQASDVMSATAVSDTSGAPVSPTAFSAVSLGSDTYTFVVLGRFEGVVHVAYYLPRATDVLRFDAIDQNVSGWSNPGLDLSSLPTNAALRAMLTTIQTN